MQSGKCQGQHGRRESGCAVHFADPRAGVHAPCRETNGENAMDMTCGMCGGRFDEADGAGACAGCPGAGGCHKVRCPHCGYEMPPPARLPRALAALFDRMKGNTK